MSKYKYVDVLFGNKITEEEYNKLSKLEQSGFDLITAVKKAKFNVSCESHEEEDE
mgnify:CR=1 FL=1